MSGGRGRHRVAECTRNVYRAGSLIGPVGRSATGDDAGAGDATAPASVRSFVDRFAFGSLDPDRAFARCTRRAGGTVAAMPIPRRYTTDAIVLSRFDLGEADRVLTLITPERRQAQGDRQGRPPADVATRWQPRAVRRADGRARARADVRRRHPGERRARVAAPPRFARVGRDRVVPGRARRPLARGAPRRRAAVRAAPPGVPAARRRDGPRARRALVRDAPARRARHAARGGPLRRMRPRPRGGRALPLGAAARRHAVRALSGAAARACRDLARRAQAAQGLPAPRHRGDRGAPPGRRDVEREVEAALREFVRAALEREARSLAFLDEVRHAPSPR